MSTYTILPDVMKANKKFDVVSGNINKPALSYAMILAEAEQHSPLGPSSMDRWLECPGSVGLSKGYPDTASSFADEGSFAHHVSQLCRANDLPARCYIGLKSSCGRFECDKAFAEGIQFFLDYTDEFETNTHLVEQQVSYDAWVPGGFGTLDDGRLVDGICNLTDLKFGKGIKVYAKNNRQMWGYALGVFQDYGHLYDIEGFKLNICQPRLDHIDEDTVSTKEILLWARDQLEPTSKIALGNNAPFKAGKHCQFCRARDGCNHRKEWIMLQMLDDLDSLESMKDPDLLSNDDLAELMEVKSLALNFWNDIERRALSEVQAGRAVGNPSWKLVAGRGSRSWRDEEGAEQALRKTKLKVAEILPPKLITPPQAEKLLGKKHPIMTEQVVKSQGKPVLVSPADPRSPVTADLSELDD